MQWKASLYIYIVLRESDHYKYTNKQKKKKNKENLKNEL